MNESTLIQNQLLATKFFVPVVSGNLISRPRLTTLLDESLKYPLTLVSAAAGFGKTTLLATWTQSLPANHPLLAWVSLDEEDNDPRLFWTYVLTALNRQQPERFTSLLMQLQSQPLPPLKSLLTALINLLVESTQQFLLILDDYQVITEQQVHTTLSYLVEHLPLQLHIILATRVDPPSLLLSQLRAYQHVLEVRTSQLRCTVEETRAFFWEVIGIQLPDEAIQEVAARTEGWLVGMQLLGLSLSGQTNPLTLLEQASGDQRYILDYLTEEVLGRQPQDIQTFLLSTSILERLTPSLCDAVLQQANSQQLLQRLEQANLFVVSLDSKRRWYRYHGLFAEALCYRLEQTHRDLVPTLHHRASLWYAQHHQTTEAILHAFRAHQWQWAADLIEQKLLQLITLTWGASEHALVTLWQWLEQLPAEVMGSRPRLYLTCVPLLLEIASSSVLDAWLNAAEATLTASLPTHMHPDASQAIPASGERSEQENLLGMVMAFRALLRSIEGNGEGAFLLCQQALSLLSAENAIGRIQIACSQLIAFYTSSANNAQASVQSGLQAASLAQAAGHAGAAISCLSAVALYTIGKGQLHEVQQVTQQAILLGRQQGERALPEVGYPTLFQADILREWNELDTALQLAEEGLALCGQIEMMVSLMFLFFGYAILLRVQLSRGVLDAACSTLQQMERIGMAMNQPLFLYIRSFYTTVDQVRLWIACGELDRATRWVEDLDLREGHGTPFAREREEVARVRILLAQFQPEVALERLEPVLQRAIAGQRWGHVIEMWLLQALAHQMCHEETLALDALWEAIRLAEPEGYIRSFVEEGAPMEALLYRLRKQNRKHGQTLYLDMLLAAFQQESVAHIRAEERIQAQVLPEPLSERELEVLQLLARGASNQEIAQELVIVVDTVKRHVSHIFAKLGVQNRVQAVRQARALGLLSKKL